MQVTFEKADLESTLKVVGGTVSSSDRGIQGHYVFRYRDGKVFLYTCSGRLFSCAPLLCEVETEEDEQSFTVEAKRLNKWLKTVDGKLKFTYKASVVKASAMLGEVKFRSLDPGMYPWWDGNLNAATKTTTVGAEGFAEILSFVRPFCSTNETTEASICSTEVVDASFLATDNSRMAVVQPTGFDGSNLRVWGKEISSVVRFLNTVGGDVEVLEHASSFMLRSESGSVFGQSRPEAPFPQVTVAPEDSYRNADTHWSFSVAEMSRAVNFLSVAAREEDYGMKLNQKGGSIILTMAAAAGGEVTVEVACTEHKGKEDLTVPVHYESFLTILGQLGSDEVVMAVKEVSAKQGMYIFHEEDDKSTQFYMIGSYYTG